MRTSAAAGVRLHQCFYRETRRTQQRVTRITLAAPLIQRRHPVSDEDFLGETRRSQLEAKSDRWPGVLARDRKGGNRAVIWPLWTANRTTCRELQHWMHSLLRPKHQEQNSVSAALSLLTKISLHNVSLFVAAETRNQK